MCLINNRDNQKWSHMLDVNIIAFFCHDNIINGIFMVETRPVLIIKYFDF